MSNSVNSWLNYCQYHSLSPFLLCCSVTQSCPTLQPHGLQHARTPCSSPSPRGLLKHMFIESVMPSNHFMLCHTLFLPPAIFPRIRSFLISQLFVSSGQSSAASVSASASVLPMSIQDWFPFRLICLIFLQSKGLSRVFSNITGRKHQFFGAQPSLWSNSYIPTWLLEKP